MSCHVCLAACVVVWTGAAVHAYPTAVDGRVCFCQARNRQRVNTSACVCWVLLNSSLLARAVRSKGCGFGIREHADGKPGRWRGRCLMPKGKAHRPTEFAANYVMERRFVRSRIQQRERENDEPPVVRTLVDVSLMAACMHACRPKGSDMLGGDAAARAMPCLEYVSALLSPLQLFVVCGPPAPALCCACKLLFFMFQHARVHMYNAHACVASFFPRLYIVMHK